MGVKQEGEGTVFDSRGEWKLIAAKLVRPCPAHPRLGANQGSGGLPQQSQRCDQYSVFSNRIIPLHHHEATLVSAYFYPAFIQQYINTAT